MRKSKKLFKRIYEELEKTGIVSDTCARVGISRQTFYRWQQEDIEFREKSLEAIQIGSELVNDIAKSNFIREIQKGDLAASRFWLLNMNYHFRKNHNHIPPPFVLKKNDTITGFEIKVVTDKQVPDDLDDEN